MRMESFWRWLGVALGKHWKIVAAVVVVITVIFGIGARTIEVATGQDRYLTPASQIAIDNVAFQDDFGGETVILLFTSNDGSDVSELYVDANLAELERITAELSEVDGTFAIVTPLTSLQFSANLLSGGATSVGSTALLTALTRDEEGADVRQADVTVSLARRVRRARAGRRRSRTRPSRSRCSGPPSKCCTGSSRFASATPVRVYDRPWT